ARPSGRRPARRTIFTSVGLLTALVGLPHAQMQRVSGTVVSAATRLPVPNARVQYEESALQTTVSDPSPQTTTTDANGYFELPAGRLGVVTVNAKGFGTGRRRWPAGNSTLGLVIELVPPASVRGTVSDLVTGRLVEAMVNVMVQNPGNFVSHSATAERGTFQIEDLPPGPALVTARSEGFAPFVGRTSIESGKVRDARIGLLLEAQATGQVVDSAGAPATGAFVRAAYVGLAGGSILSSFVGGRPLTGSDGVFAIGGLVPDTPIALQAELGGRRSAVERIKVGPGMRQLGIVLTLP
ncbi:MAG: carboxypeptidase regulatory-like domain-containing protein, partial [Rhodococcus sp.]|nr:carboxypeptidase regulatory-like domain-containing protein [Rhodococcus sp. (in: high G+C Gram-positive bacteria)]